ncbi:MAG: DsrE family protein [Anaerolineaceae bacterium]|nr:DsrE family protein [Anaerolineaceae bacterium]
MEENGLCVIWSSADREVALECAFMYAHNSKKKGWWGKVRLIIWGPSGKLLMEDKQIQKKVKEMMKDGVEILACKSCADHLKISEDLIDFGVDVMYAGAPLTNMLKSGWKVLTY